MSKDQSKPTVEAVRVWQRERVRRAAQMRAADPFVEPYEPSIGRCQNLCSQMSREREESLLADNPQATPEEIKAERDWGPHDALVALKLKAQLEDTAYAKEKAKGREREENFAGFQKRESEKTRAARAVGLTPGQRIDNALAGLAIVASSHATGGFEAKVTGSKEHDPIPLFPGDPQAKARQEALKAARFCEDELEAARRRRVELERAA